MTLTFLCVMTKNDLNEDSYIVEGWLYRFILPHKGRSYMTLTNKKSQPKFKGKKRFTDLTNLEKELIDFS